MEKIPCVYVLASQPNGTLYVGFTSNLPKRLLEHQMGLVAGFTREHCVKRLVWYEQHSSIESAIAREKAIKRWLRRWKIHLIEKTNPLWEDLSDEVV